MVWWWGGGKSIYFFNFVFLFLCSYLRLFPPPLYCSRHASVSSRKKPPKTTMSMPGSVFRNHLYSTLFMILCFCHLVFVVFVTAGFFYVLFFVCLEFQIICFLIITFTPIFFIEISFVLLSDGMQCCGEDSCFLFHEFPPLLPLITITPFPLPYTLLFFETRETIYIRNLGKQIHWDTINKLLCLRSRAPKLKHRDSHAFQHPSSVERQWDFCKSSQRQRYYSTHAPSRYHRSCGLQYYST